MGTGANCNQDDLVCIYCHATYESTKELEIHSWIHSACCEKIIPIFNLVKINKSNKNHNIDAKTSTDSQDDSAIISEVVEKLISGEESSLMNNSVKDSNSKTCDSGFVSPSSPGEEIELIILNDSK